MGNLDGKIALITGAGRGIGREIALVLAREGVRVAACGRSVEQIESTAKEIGGVAVACDVTDRRSVEAAVKGAETALGPIDILVNNAGVSSSNPLGRTTDEQWESMLNTNLRGPFYLSRVVLPGMKERGFGRIVNVASRAGRVGFPYVSAYCASKFGLVGLTLALAEELAGSGVTANAVCPGWVDTDMARRSVENIRDKTGMTIEEGYAQIAALNESGAMLTPERVATEVARLCCGNDNGQLIDME